MIPAIVVAGLSSSPPASAATTVGETFSPGVLCIGPGVFLQSASPGGQYAAPTAGILTSGSFQAPAGTVPNPFKLKVARPAGGNNFTIVGESETQALAPNNLATFPLHVPVQPGDVLGLFVGNMANCARSNAAPGWSQHSVGGDPAVGTTLLFNGPNMGLQFDVSAILEPDCDGDGLADESEDSDIVSCDATPPVTTITGGPKAKTRKKTATFTFEGTDARVIAGFECSLDGAAFSSCASPHTLRVKKGRHDFNVRATDTNGNAESSGATYSWKVKKKKKR